MDDRKHRETRILLGAIVGALILLATGCIGCGGLYVYFIIDLERPRQLPNGYEMRNIKGYGWFIEQGDGHVVVPSASRSGDAMVLEVAVAGDVVVGQADDATPGSGRYFVFDTRSGHLTENITREEAAALLKAAGHEMPELRLPRRLPRK